MVSFARNGFKILKDEKYNLLQMLLAYNSIKRICHNYLMFGKHSNHWSFLEQYTSFVLYSN